MTQVVLGMSVSLDGIAGPEFPDEDGMAVFAAVLGWVFPLRSWREQQGMEGGEDSVDSQVWRATSTGSARRSSAAVEVIQGPGAVHLRYEVVR